MRLLRTAGMSFLVCLLAISFSARGFCADAESGEAAKPVKMSAEDQKKYDLALEKALVHYEKAQLLHEQSKLEETAKEIEAIVALEYPEAAKGAEGDLMQIDMHSFLGELYLELGKQKDAVDTVKKGIARAPEISTQSYQLYMTLGHAYKQMKKVDDALAAFEKAEKINEELLKREKKEKKEAEETE